MSTKYSSKCLKHVILLAPNIILPKQNVQNLFDIFYNIILDQNIVSQQIVKKCIPNIKTIKKIYNHKTPLMCILFNTINKTNKIDNFINNDGNDNNDKIIFDSDNCKSFVQSYSKNQHMINTDAFLKYRKDFNLENQKIIDYMYNNIDIDRQCLHDLLYNNKFVGIDIQKIAESNDIKYMCYDFIDEKIKIHVYIPENNLKNETNINIQRIIHICQIMRTISKQNNQIKLVIFYTNQKKKLSKFDEELLLGAININSGSTYRGEVINIWRAEELYKVLIHELIHYYHLDFNENTHGYETIQKILHCDCNSYKNIYRLNKSYESYTEYLALIISTAYNAFLLNDKNLF